jgi:hypothetical protein
MPSTLTHLSAVIKQECAFRQGVFISPVFLQSWLHFPANFREWERQPFFLTLIAKKWLPRPQFIAFPKPLAWIFSD